MQNTHIAAAICSRIFCNYDHIYKIHRPVIRIVEQQPVVSIASRRLCCAVIDRRHALPVHIFQRHAASVVCQIAAALVRTLEECIHERDIFQYAGQRSRTQQTVLIGHFEVGDGVSAPVEYTCKIPLSVSAGYSYILAIDICRQQNQLALARIIYVYKFAEKFICIVNDRFGDVDRALHDKFIRFQNDFRILAGSHALQARKRERRTRNACGHLDAADRYLCRIKRTLRQLPHAHGRQIERIRACREVEIYRLFFKLQSGFCYLYGDFGGVIFSGSARIFYRNFRIARADRNDLAVFVLGNGIIAARNRKLRIGHLVSVFIYGNFDRFFKR